MRTVLTVNRSRVYIALHNPTAWHHYRACVLFMARTAACLT